MRMDMRVHVCVDACVDAHVSMCALPPWLRVWARVQACVEMLHRRAQTCPHARLCGGMSIRTVRTDGGRLQMATTPRAVRAAELPVQFGIFVITGKLVITAHWRFKNLIMSGRFSMLEKRRI